MRGNEIPNRVLTDTILDILGHDESMVEYVTDRLGHDRRYSIDTHEGAGPRLGAARRVPGRARGHGRLVPRPSLVVGAAAAVGADHRPVRILITGAGGQVGHELVAACAGDDVTAADHDMLDVSDRSAVLAAVTSAPA